VRACRASAADQRRQACGGAEGLLLGSVQHREPLRQGDLHGVRRECGRQEVELHLLEGLEQEQDGGRDLVNIFLLLKLPPINEGLRTYYFLFKVVHIIVKVLLGAVRDDKGGGGRKWVTAGAEVGAGKRMRGHVLGPIQITQDIVSFRPSQ
jgi:hypothetical protein